MGTIIGLITSFGGVSEAPQLYKDNEGNLYFVDYPGAINVASKAGPLYLIEEKDYTPAMKALYGSKI